MKKLFYIFTASLLIAVGCTKDASKVMNQLSGDWHYAAEENGVKEDIWISFSEDGTFEMFQKIGDGPYWYTKGEYALDSKTKVLSGIYSDRYPWKYSYKVSISDKTLEMAAVELEDYKLTYAKETIPAQVREKSLPLTKSESVELFL
jgi:hypothetical protein